MGFVQVNISDVIAQERKAYIEFDKAFEERRFIRELISIRKESKLT